MTTFSYSNLLNTLIRPSHGSSRYAHTSSTSCASSHLHLFITHLHTWHVPYFISPAKHAWSISWLPPLPAHLPNYSPPEPPIPHSSHRQTANDPPETLSQTCQSTTTHERGALGCWPQKLVSTAHCAETPRSHPPCFPAPRTFNPLGPSTP